MKRLKFILLLIALTVLFGGCSADVVNKRTSESGVLDLTDWDPSRNGSISLDGEWELYLNQFVDYKQLDNAEPDYFASIPYTLGKYLQDKRNPDFNDYATYRLHVKTSLPQGSRLSIGACDSSFTYKIFVNDTQISVEELISETGHANKYERPIPIPFLIPSDEFDIIIHVSDFVYCNTSFGLKIMLGSEQGIENLYLSRMIKIGFLYGMIIIVAFFFLCASFLGLKIKYPVYFSILSLLFLFYHDSLNYNLFLQLFDSFNTELRRVLIYSSSTWVFFFLTLYNLEFYKTEYSGTIFKALAVITLLQQVFIVLNVYTMPNLSELHILRIVAAFELLTNVFIVLHGEIRLRKASFRNLLGILIIAAAYYHNFSKVITYYEYFMFVAILLFLILQMLFMAKLIKKFYEEKKNAELRFLHAQIKPHYIFNALNTIISISRYNFESARQLLCDFSIYLQKSFYLRSENQFTSLKDEIELVNVYLNIEKARFEERIEIEMQLPENTDFSVPVCILQPIVENAIVHGILSKPEGGRIFISIEHKKDRLLFTVRDTGVGMSGEKIIDVLESDNIGHIGLSNINKRINAFYGRGLIINSKPDEGTEVIWEVILNN